PRRPLGLFLQQQAAPHAGGARAGVDLLQGREARRGAGLRPRARHVARAQRSGNAASHAGKMSVRVAISGAGGRMGRALLDAVAASGDTTLAGSFDIGGDVRAALSAADVLVDFTRPEGTLEHLRACVDAKRAMVIGTTGFDVAQLARIREAAREI